MPRNSIDPAVIDRLPALDERPEVVYRQAGDRFVLVEYGEMVLDLKVNFRILGLNEAINTAQIDGLIETVPALRTILIHYDSRKLLAHKLIDSLKQIEKAVPSIESLTIASRRIELPIAFDDPHTRAAIERYVKFTRQDAPNIINGHNIDYIAQYNGLSGKDEVIRYLCSTLWWNASIGFWPGLPFMFPLDPRYAIVTPKYNPTRPWTPEGAVGIGGPCVAIYPVVSPGGYQLFGWTIPIFNLQQRNTIFKDNPILLRASDRVQFTPVTTAELESIREMIDLDSYRYRIVPYEALNVKAYLQFLDSVKEEVISFQERQAEAMKRTPVP